MSKIVDTKKQNEINHCYEKRDIEKRKQEDAMWAVHEKSSRKR